MAGSLIEALLDEELALIVSAWLTAVETTWLRATSQSSKRLFVRNCPAKEVTWTGVGPVVFLYFEEDLLNRIPFFDSEDLDDFADVPGRNPHSPMRCWRFDAVSYILDIHAVGPPTEETEKLLLDRDIVFASVRGYGNLLFFCRREGQAGPRGRHRGRQAKQLCAPLRRRQHEAGP
mmetsp:Transcript_28573/g.87470  ORF Transcript_28573/g.87470 Transcript_28573/m.87470 type:complete len:176 (+) Transcript_28573:119-646(+)